MSSLRSLVSVLSRLPPLREVARRVEAKSEPRVLTLHIGLPKTATTFLQRQVFRGDDRLTYIYTRKQGPIEKVFKKQQRVSPQRFPKIEKELKALLPGGDILLSDENISMQGQELWRGEGPRPRSFCQRATQLQGMVGTLRVILGIRRQDQWLASRYAESGKVHEEFCQEDFDRRAREICESEAKGALKWLDYYNVYKRLSECLGPENLLILPMEVVGDEPEKAIRMLEEFLGVSGWVEAFERNKDDAKPRNVLNRGADTWKLKGHEGMLQLDGPTKTALLERYSKGNKKLDSILRMELDCYGYY